MLTVAQALERVLALMTPVGVETATLDAIAPDAAPRVLAAPVAARRDQPPFAASAMDGYAVRAADATPGARLTVIGAAPAGRAFAGAVGPGQAVRIFTGAPVPEGADAILIQEDADRRGEHITVAAPPEAGRYIRPAGLDFAAGAQIAAPRRLTPFDLALAAAMNAPSLTLRRRPRVALLPTGDELVSPGQTPGPDQIVASSGFGVAALLSARGAAVTLRPIAPDSDAALRDALAQAAAQADLVVTLGGASVGDHDLVRDAIGAEALDFYRIAMRPGKPLMAGRLGPAPIVGLPGNPVSAMVCALLFLRPAVDALLGLPAAAPARRMVPLAVALPAGGPREHYMRATLTPDGAARPFDNQDSALQSVLAQADCLAVRPPHAPPAAAGDMIAVIDLNS